MKSIKLIKPGSVYDTDGRKGLLTLKILEEVNWNEDSFVDVEIMQGNVRYLSTENRICQKLDGQGTPGHKITVRTTLCHLKKRRPELEGE